MINATAGVSTRSDIVAQSDAKEGIRQGLQDAKVGKTRPAKEFFDEFETNHGMVPQDRPEKSSFRDASPVEESLPSCIENQERFLSPFGMTM